MNNIIQKFSAVGLVVAFVLVALILPFNAIAQTAFSVSITSPSSSSVTAQVGEQINFVAQATGGTSPVAYLWNFGDGTQFAGASASKSYATAGNRTVTVTATDSLGSRSTDTIEVTVNAESGDFTATITNPSDDADFDVSEVINFVGEVSGGTAPFSYLWNFGDGTTIAGLSANKSYPSDGSRTVTFTATDAEGNRSTDTITVNIGDSNSGDDLAISNVQVASKSSNSATITWTTNKPATSRVIYGTSSNQDISDDSAPNYGYANSTSTQNDLVTSHSVTVTGLSANTQYFFRVISTR